MLQSAAKRLAPCPPRSQGDTEADALENIQDAIREYLAVALEQVKGAEVREVDVVALRVMPSIGDATEAGDPPQPEG